MRKSTTIWTLVILTVLIATGTLLNTAAAQKASVPKVQDRLAMGEDDVRHLLQLVDLNPKGMVTKHEYMKFMEAEFDRLDKERKGELDVHKLAQASLSAVHYVGK